MTWQYLLKNLHRPMLAPVRVNKAYPSLRYVTSILAVVATIICVRDNGSANNGTHKGSALIATADFMGKSAANETACYCWQGAAVAMVAKYNSGVAVSVTGMVPAIATMVCRTVAVSISTPVGAAVIIMACMTLTAVATIAPIGMALVGLAYASMLAAVARFHALVLMSVVGL